MVALHGSFLSIILSESLLSKWVSTVCSGPVYSQVGLYNLKMVCAVSSGPVQGGSVLT